MNNVSSISAAKRPVEAPIDTLCAAALALQPVIRARAQKMERQARLDDDIIEALDDAGLFSLLVPKRWGGPGLGMAEVSRISEILGGSDLSTCWVSNFYMVHEHFIGGFSDEVKDQVYDGRKSSRCAAVFNPPGQVERVSGGWKLTGKWAYASGIVHAHFILLPAMIEGVMNWMLVPRESVNVIYDWEMGSMSATGSHTVTADDIFVADGWAMPIQALVSTRASGPIDLSGMSALIGALDYALEVSKETMVTSKPYGVARMDREASRIRWAQARQILQVARIVRDTKVRELLAWTPDSPVLDESAQGSIALDGMFVSHSTKDAMRLLMDGSGTSVYKLDSPIRRIAGDIAMMSTHVLGSDYDVLMDRHARWALGLGMGGGDPSVRLI